MAGKKAASKFLETRYFGLVIGLVVFLILLALSSGTVILKGIEQTLLDLNFRLRNGISSSRLQEGVSVVQKNDRISPDIMILGIDDRSLGGSAGGLFLATATRTSWTPLHA